MRGFWRWLTISLMLIIILSPLFVQILWSFAFRWYFPSLLPGAWSLRAWQTVFDPSARVGEALINSILLAVLVSLLSILVGLPAARALALHSFRGKAIIEWLLLIPIIAPSIVVTMGIHIAFIHYRLTDSYLGVTLVHLIPCVPYMVLVMTSVFANYGTDLEETARTLGAGALRTFVHVTLPAIFPGLLVATMFTFLISWSQYVSTLLIGGGRIITLPIVLFPFISGANNSVAAAISLVFVLPAIIVLVFTTRSLASEASVMGGFGKL